MRTSALLVWLALVSGCSAIRLEKPAPVVDLTGTFAGSLTMQGQQFPGTLSLTQDGSDLAATFHAPDLDLTADGTGAVAADGGLTLTLDYQIQCPGTAHLVGRWTEGGAHLSGAVTADDCTGNVSGDFDFRRR